MRKPRSSAKGLAITMLALIGLINGNVLAVAVQSTAVDASSDWCVLNLCAAVLAFNSCRLEVS